MERATYTEHYSHLHFTSGKSSVLYIRFKDGHIYTFFFNTPLNMTWICLEMASDLPSGTGQLLICIHNASQFWMWMWSNRTSCLTTGVHGGSHTCMSSHVLLAWPRDQVAKLYASSGSWWAGKAEKPRWSVAHLCGLTFSSV